MGTAAESKAVVLVSNKDIGTIRNLYGNHKPVNGTYENAIHGSDSKESAEREISFFFTDNEINNWA